MHSTWLLLHYFDLNLSDFFCPPAVEDILSFHSVSFLSHSSAACGHQLAYVEMYTHFFLFGHLISAPLRNNNKPGDAGPSIWQGSSVKCFCESSELVSRVQEQPCAWGLLHAPTSVPGGLRPAVMQVLTPAFPGAPRGACWRHLGL